MDPRTLSTVLAGSAARAPKLHPATIFGWRMKMCSSAYPALVPGSPTDTVHGVACIIRSMKEADKLAEYETDMYRIESCEIHLDGDDDGSKVEKVNGRIFVWNADESLLNEGSFDLRDWVLKRRELDIYTR